MQASDSVGFFDRQFRKQVAEADFALNPFERTVLPFLSGRVLDFGCGLGNLSLAAAEQGCEVLALDASPAAISALRGRAGRAGVPVEAVEADLRAYALQGTFDGVVSIGLLAFFDCPGARSSLGRLRDSVKPGGILALNTLIRGTTWTDAFGANHCLLDEGELENCVDGWTVIYADVSEFPAAGNTLKRFATLIARRPTDGQGPAEESSATPR